MTDPARSRALTRTIHPVIRSVVHALPGAATHSGAAWHLVFAPLLGAAALLLAPGAASAGPIDRHAIFGKTHFLRPAAADPGTAPASAVGDRGYDVEHYDLSIDVGDSTIAGRVTIAARALAAPLAEMTLDLYPPLEVTGFSGTHAIDGITRSGKYATVRFLEPVPAGLPFVVTLSYEGRPASVGGEITEDPLVFTTHGSAANGTLAPAIFTLSTPNRSGAWWPCKDVLDDKALYRVEVTTAPSLHAVSNGAAEGPELVVDPPGPPGPRRVVAWAGTAPISTYLVSLAISNYATFADSARIAVEGDSVTVPLRYWVYPEDLEDAKADFVRIPAMMRFCSDLFGPYPFRREKYGMAAIRWSGALEHQTCTSLASELITGDRGNEWVHVHELAHQWWGDSVTLRDWRDVWLNEGFATYTEALWTEHTKGDSAFRAYMETLDPFPPPDYPDFRGTVYDPDPLFGSTPYKKGAWILHMLRHIVSDEDFFPILRTYGARFANGNVATADFVGVAEEVSGRSLGTFFDQWLRYTGRPEYLWSWGTTRSGAGWDVEISIEQLQDQLHTYEMPVDIVVRTESGTRTFVAENRHRRESFVFHVEARPLDVGFDPGGWILKPLRAPERAPEALRAPLPNPTRGTSAISYRLAAAADVQVRVYDVSGRLVKTLVDAKERAEEHVVWWDGKNDAGDDASSGVYYILLTTPSITERTKLVLAR